MDDLLIDLIVTAVIFLFPLWKIHQKAGQSPALSLLVLVPFIGPLISILILAFVPWDSQKVTKQGGIN